MPLDTNPLAVLTFIAAPAIMTNAASILALGTSNRFARSIDRVRAIIKQLGEDDANEKKSPALAAADQMYRTQLVQYEMRARLLVRAMSRFYLSVGCFAAGSLTSLLGAVIASTDHPWLLRAILGAALVAGIVGLSGLIAGGALLVRETRLALLTISEEAAFYRARYGSSRGGKTGGGDGT
ncbi:MAG: hypothetical protein QOF78_2212 [Phycisphaerales bacterium]|nr:hypothetical protein [Phycisphaerales bacterium]